MLGTFRQSLKYKTVDDFRTLSDYFHYFFDDVNGYVYSCGKYHNQKGDEIFYNNGVNLATLDFDDLKHSRRFSDIESRVCYDRYMTLNTFTYVKSKSDGKPCLARRVENAKRLNALFVDIDCYNVGMTPDEIIYELTYNLRDYKVPQWTFLIKSGKGVYVVWKLRNEDGYVVQNRHRWQAIERYLCQQLSPLGADSKATDCSRVLRIPFSYNSKNGAQVYIDSFCDVSYSLYELCYDYVPEVYLKKTVKRKRKPIERRLTSRMIFCADKIAQSLNVPSPTESSDFAKVWGFINEHKEMIKERSVCYSANGSIPAYRAKCCAENASDIERLMAMRFSKEDGHREVALFLYRLMLMWAFEDADLALSRTLALNASFSTPLDANVVSKATESAVRHYKRYNVSRAYIAEMLDITNEESGLLSFLPPFGGKVSRPKNVDGAKRAVNNRAYYVRTLAKRGDVPKKDKLSVRREKIAKLVAEGYNCDSICSLIGVSRSTLYRDLSFLGLSLCHSESVADSSESIADNNSSEGEGVEVPCDNSDTQESSMDMGVEEDSHFSAVSDVSFFKTPTISYLHEVPNVFYRPPIRLLLFWLYDLGGDADADDSGGSGGVPPPP